MSDAIKAGVKKLEQYVEMLQSAGVQYVPRTVEEVRTPQRAAREEPVSDTPDSPYGGLLALRTQVLACEKCHELAGSRNTVVFGAGNAKADLVFVGEAPGFHEDRQGLPFVGRAGELLTKMIEAMGLRRGDVFICNVLKCRPPNNRNPNPEEVINCEPYLVEQLKLIRPKAICAMGKFAAQTLLKSERSISALRGEVHDYKGIPCVATFHPAYLLRNPADKRKAWEDLKVVMDLLGLKGKK